MQEVQDFFERLAVDMDQLLQMNDDDTRRERETVNKIFLDTQKEMEIVSQIYSERLVTISVLGLHNTGKSTLINTLLGRRYSVQINN